MIDNPKTSDKNFGTFGDGKSKITYPQTAPPEAMTTTLRKEYARRLLMYELHMSEAKTENKAVECEKKKEIREYFMSTANRRDFIMRCCLANLNEQYISVPETTKLLGMSDQGMTTMIKNCVQKGWILLDKNKYGHRQVKATEITIETWLDYADYVSIISNKFGFVYLNASRNTIENLTE